MRGQLDPAKSRAGLKVIKLAPRLFSAEATVGSAIFCMYFESWGDWDPYKGSRAKFAGDAGGSTVTGSGGGPGSLGGHALVGAVVEAGDVDGRRWTERRPLEPSGWIVYPPNPALPKRGILQYL